MLPTNKSMYLCIVGSLALRDLVLKAGKSFFSLARWVSGSRSQVTPSKAAVEIKHVRFGEMLHVLGVCSVDIGSRLRGDENQLIGTDPDHIAVGPQGFLDLEGKFAGSPVGAKSDASDN